MPQLPQVALILLKDGCRIGAEGLVRHHGGDGSSMRGSRLVERPVSRSQPFGALDVGDDGDVDAIVGSANGMRRTYVNDGALALMT